MLCARLLCLAAVAAAAAAADMPKVTLKESGNNGESCDLTKVSAQLAMTSSCDVKTTVLGSDKPISLKAVSAKVDTAVSTLSALAKGVNKMKCDSVGLEGTRFGVGSGCACPACENNGNLPTQVPDGANPCQCQCPAAWEGEQCQNKVVCDKDKHCNGHATAATGFLADADGCQCTCIAEPGNTWKGSTCDTCESGADYDGTDATKKSRWQNENGQCAPCPDGWDCNGSSTKTDVEECAKETNKCNYGATCYDSHSAAPNTKAVGTWTCGCDTVTETTADKVFFDATTQNCEYKPCADKDDEETWTLSGCQTGSATSTWHDGTTITSTSVGSQWDQTSTMSECKCSCNGKWGGSLCTDSPLCAIDKDQGTTNSLCKVANTKSVYGFIGSFTFSSGGTGNGCHCECEDGWTGPTCEQYAEPSTTTWEYVTEGNCPVGARVDTAAECTAAYEYLEGEEDVATLIDRSSKGDDPTGCHVGDQLSIFSTESTGSCSSAKKCLCRKSTGITVATSEYTAQQMQYGIFSVDPNKTITYWTREDSTACTAITDADMCTTAFNEGSVNSLHGNAAGTEVTGITRSGFWHSVPYGCFVDGGKLMLNRHSINYDQYSWGDPYSTISQDSSPKQCDKYNCLCQQIGATSARR